MFFHLFILVFMNCVKNCLFFHVNFQYFYGAQLEPFNTQLQKREMAQFFDKAAYSFNGLEKIESVPVSFPIDICVLPLEGVKYAAALHRNKNGVRHFTIYKNVNHNYREMHTIATPNATAMDCKSLGPKGYIALAFNLTQPIENARDGSPIYELTADDRLRAVQYFAATHLYSIYLRTTGNDLFMLQTFRSSGKTSQPRCPYYKWSGTSFTLLARIPCSNARHVEPFAINYESYVALANYADQTGRTTTYSEIYKFVHEKKQFQLVQKIRTYGAVDVRYFSVPLDEVRRRYFLVFGNSVSRRRGSGGDANEVDSVFYLFDKGQFVPYQSLPLYAVEQFLPVQNMEAEKFLLLIASKDQDAKIYNLNDWKFEPSGVQFTEGALSQGVSKMRIYQENETSYLVIANEKMNENDTNIFLPIFKQDEHANALRQQIIDWTKMQIGRLSQINVNKLKNDVEQKLAQNEIQKQSKNFNVQLRDILQSDIQTVTTNSFVYPKHHFTSHYWQALNFATQAVIGLEAELSSPTAKRLKRSTNVTSDPIMEFANIKVDTLVIKEHLQAKQVNRVESARPTLEHIKAKKVRVTGKYEVTERSPAADGPTMVPTTSSLAVKHLRINGNLNEYKWHDLLNHTLKREGMQFVKQPTHMASLVAESVRVLSDEIDGNNLLKLIPIDGGDSAADASTYVVRQSVRFEGPVKAKELLIHERLNQIQVRQNKLDVLLKNANETQVVDGAKRFEHVRILQPIAMAVSQGGQTLGSRLQSLSPQQIIHNDLILNGDFIIKGDAIVSDFLSVGDLIDRNSQMSTKQALLNGLDITQPLEDVNINFEETLEANNTILTFINAVDMQQLIKTNFKHLQVLEGEKHFKKALEIRRGFSEVKYINGIDIESLTERLLFKSANQSVQAPMHFGKLLTYSITANHIKMKDKPLDSFLTRTGNQHMPITLSVTELSTQTLNIEKLHTNGRIFGKAMTSDDEQSLIGQLLSNQSRYMDLLPPNRKFPNTIFVDNLRLKDGSVNGLNVHDIEKKLKHLNADIKFEGNYKFNYDMNISQLTFQGKFNDIAAELFGRCWLQKSGMQVFTVPQSFSEVHCSKGVTLDGSLNGRALEDFYTKAYWTNRNEYIDAMKFQNPIQIQAPLRTTTLNSMHVPLDIIHFNSSVPQILYASASVHRDLNLLDNGGIYNVSTLNGVHLLAFQQFLKAGSGDTLHVEHANFAQTPLYRTLNHYELPTLLDKVWLANENVRLTQHVELANATFEGLLEFEGLVNNINLHYLKDNYFSLTRPQEIGTEMMMGSEAKFEGDLTANNVQLAGFLVDSSSDLAMNFDEFFVNTLKTDGPHEVCASWSLLTALIQGDVENVQINNLNLAQDVVRLNMPHASLTAPKTVKVSSIEKLCPTRSSTINRVPVADWLQQAVYVHGNHTINGITTLDTVNMYNDLSVFGIVNNISNFGEQTLLLRNLHQTLHGDVHINNLFPKERRILVNNFENLRAKSVNGQTVDAFYKDQAKLSSVVVVEGNLAFMQPLVVQDYHNRGAREAMWKRTSSTIDEVMRTSNELSQMPSWKTTLTMDRKLRRSLKATFYALNKFNIRQKLKTNGTKIVSFKISEENGQTMDLIGVVDETNKISTVQYYQWSIQEAHFRPIQEYTWLPKEGDFLEFLEFFSSDVDGIAVLNKTTTAQLISSLRSFFENLRGEKNITIITFFAIAGEHCFATNMGPKTDSIGIFCVKKEFESAITIYEKFTLPRNDIRQVLRLDGDKIALLLAEGIEIWRSHPHFEFMHLLPLSKATKGVSAKFNNVTFLAIQLRKESNSLSNGAIEIYRSINSTHFDHMQSLDCVDPIQFSFSKIALTDDLLLYVLGQSIVAPLTIYQYKGVLGFKRIVGASTLAVGQAYKILDLENATKPMVMLMNDGDLTFVEIALRKY
ncbi:uncharacterized protein LOC118744618 [Rhagoletis pomonella]|uniref:uncharacterized protein LOC118744618 n=1 Tax=Rhagoletis pomonella TaxID=28610 RepID=UPI00177AD09F|nr:uncharacterized protein LOC118744618 [Rhagoletis pomonella]